MEYNKDSKDYQENQQEDEYEYNRGKKMMYVKYSQMPMGGSSTNICPFYGNPMYCPMLKNMPYNCNPMMQSQYPSGRDDELSMPYYDGHSPNYGSSQYYGSPYHYGQYYNPYNYGYLHPSYNYGPYYPREDY